ncbi:MAG: class I fructose-bisphosphate aldolase, partial [Verrucomicrobiota bacterium]
MTAHTMESTVAEILAPGKGILAADESFPTIEKRFKAIGVSSTEENRRAYRELLFATPGLNEFISGVILFDETLRQKSTDGVPFTELLARQGIVPGIKVDKGTVALPNFAGEKMTQGLDGLRERLKEYHGLGARFTKWRAVIKIDEHIPSATCVATNARALALFAALSQEAGLVPIVEPEVLMDGNHTIEGCEEVSGVALKAVF